ncbi:MAG: chorismate mutase [Paracoccaceae bacterium]|jgi:isochorismate pyruvate lyase|nr:chorismate mutase [Paracoccaceae bacterium]
MEPDQFGSMAELRVEIDALDGQIVALLARRTRLVDRAAQLKPAENLPARIPSRVEEVVAKVRIKAEAAGMDPDLAERLWREMIEHFIAQEERILGKGDQA